MISISGKDKSMCQLLSHDFTDYLVDLATKLESDYYFKHEGTLFSFPKDVT